MGECARLGRYPILVRLDAIMTAGGVTERLMVPLSKSGVGFAHRGFESHPLRQR